jgi:micrococcal nuclease
MAAVRGPINNYFFPLLNNSVFSSRFIFIVLFSVIPFFYVGCQSGNTETIAGTIEGKVVSITDGDTFILLTKDKSQKKIRLYGIDCPEKRQPFGSVAKDKLSELIFGKQVNVQVKGLDRWKRTVGTVFFDGENINERMLQEGMAWHFTRYDDKPSWSLMESEARTKRIGLWSDDNVTPPWEWRKKTYSKKANN